MNIKCLLKQPGLMFVLSHPHYYPNKLDAGVVMETLTRQVELWIAVGAEQNQGTFSEFLKPFFPAWYIWLIYYQFITGLVGYIRFGCVERVYKIMQCSSLHCNTRLWTRWDANHSWAKRKAFALAWRGTKLAPWQGCCARLLITALVTAPEGFCDYKRCV